MKYDEDNSDNDTVDKESTKKKKRVLLTTRKKRLVVQKHFDSQKQRAELRCSV